jgi:hypothetical protein
MQLGFQVTQALFVMEGAVRGHTGDQMAVVFQGNKQLVSMWILFLKRNQWIKEKVNGWTVTAKGQMWSKRIANSTAI